MKALIHVARGCTGKWEVLSAARADAGALVCTGCGARVTNPTPELIREASAANAQRRGRPGPGHHEPGTRG